MRVDVSGKTFSFPQRCVCCGRPPDTYMFASATRATGVRVVRSRTSTWRFPACSACTRHVRAWQWAGNAIVGAIVGGVCLGLVALVAIGGLAFIAVMLITAGAAVWLRHSLQLGARAQCAPDCASTWQAVGYLGWNGSVQSFDFAQGSYALEFMTANRKKLVGGCPDAERLLAGHVAQIEERAANERRAREIERQGELERQHREAEARVVERETQLSKKRAEAEEDAARRRVAMEEREAQTRAEREEAARIREDDDFFRAVTKIESAKGPAGRRAGLEAGLRTLKRPDMKERLLLEASRIEVQAALDKAETLKSPAAKLRTLRAALDEVRNDRVPDELQTKQIRWLEEAIAAIEDEKNSIEEV